MNVYVIMTKPYCDVGSEIYRIYESESDARQFFAEYKDQCRLLEIDECHVVSKRVDEEEEAELLLLGRNPLVSSLDDHHSHITAHRELLNRTDVRSRPEVLEAILEHLQAHIDGLV